MTGLKFYSLLLILLTGFATAAAAEVIKPEKAMPPRPGATVTKPKPCGSEKEEKKKDCVESKEKTRPVRPHNIPVPPT